MTSLNSPLRAVSSAARTRASASSSAACRLELVAEERAYRHLPSLACAADCASNTSSMVRSATGNSARCAPESQSCAALSACPANAQAYSNDRPTKSAARAAPVRAWHSSALRSRLERRRSRLNRGKPQGTASVQPSVCNAAWNATSASSNLPSASCSLPFFSSASQAALARRAAVARAAATPR